MAGFILGLGLIAGLLCYKRRKRLVRPLSAKVVRARCSIE